MMSGSVHNYYFRAANSHPASIDQIPDSALLVEKQSNGIWHIILLTFKIHETHNRHIDHIEKRQKMLQT